MVKEENKMTDNHRKEQDDRERLWDEVGANHRDPGESHVLKVNLGG